jgi:hypothetical protein
MGSSSTPVAGGAATSVGETRFDRTLPSGRSVQLKLDGAGEAIEVRSPGGEVEVRIAFTAAGPVVTVHGGRLELGAPEVAIRCKTFEVEASAGVEVKTPGDIKMNGAMIRLNCTDESA